jgi:type II restriction/modification system DNA methylase subunit YeeA
MDTSNLKRFAPACRSALLEQIGAKLEYVLTAQTPDLAAQEDLLEDLREVCKVDGREAVIDRVAYTWFNRFTAFRYIDAHGWHPFRTRVITASAEGDVLPELLQQVRKGVVPPELQDYLPISRLNDLLDGKLPSANPQAEVQRHLIIGVSQFYADLLPALFDPVDAYTQLLLPDDLLTEHSVVHGFVSDISDADCADIEIIGWLYQFYISEKKDEVIGKVVKSEDIPAATQLFTPNWIVKYMVQNSLGAQWLATYPNSPLKGQMEYYIEPAEQTDEVNAQLAAITPSQLNPEELTLIDPASGSGHILVEAYELFKAIYLERGYRQRDVPELILEKNLFGLDIDERAAQLTGFALMMKGRADDRRLFERGVKLNVMALVDSAGFDAEGLAKGVELSDYGLKPGDLTELKRLFEHATTFGSLIQVPEGLAAKLPALKQLSEATSQDLFVSEALKCLGPLVQQAEMLAAEYDAVVANPPYMASKSFCPELKVWVNKVYRGYERDLFAAFIARILALTKETGHLGVMTSFVWMFLASFEQLRRAIIGQHTMHSLVQLHYDAFADAKAHICTFVAKKRHVGRYAASFVRLVDFPGVDVQGPKTLEAIRNRTCDWFFEADQSDFEKIPGSPIAYWVGQQIVRCYESGELLSDRLKTAIGLNTGDNNRFLRQWYEVGTKPCLTCDSIDSAAVSESKWFPYAKGGSFRKWYGNRGLVINWESDGAEVKEFAVERNRGKHWSRYIQNLKWMFKPGITWSFVSSYKFGVRFHDAGSLFDVQGSSAFLRGNAAGVEEYLGLLCSPVAFEFLKAQNSTLTFLAGNVGNIPWIRPASSRVVSECVKRLVELARTDWNAYERSWDFQSLPLLPAASEPTPTLESSYTAWTTQNRDTIAEMKRLEEENNRLFIDAYGLGEELTPDVPIEQITLTVNPAYRYGGKLTFDAQWTRFRQETMEELVSYAIGCMMGRYSLDAPGLIYAHSGNEGFDPANYTTFPADDDGIVPITEDDWFEDDAASRVREFLRVTFGPKRLEENIAFLEEALGKELRKYFTANTGGFYANHVQTYKKRPIYWMFESPKKHFRALVYLHRYTRDTVNTLLNGYLREFRHKITHRRDELQALVDREEDTATDRKALKKTGDALRDVEAYERDILLPLAQQRLEIDLDDGVKANYPKFGKALAKVTGLS